MSRLRRPLTKSLLSCSMTCQTFTNIQLNCDYICQKSSGNLNRSKYNLRIVLPFVTVLTFCVSQVWSEVLGFLSVIQRYFCAVYSYVEKEILAWAIRIQKENWMRPCIFLETIELKFGKKCHMLFCILKLFYL